MTFGVIATLVFLGGLGILTLISAADSIGALFAWIANPMLRKLGLQTVHDPGKEFLGRRAKVVSIEGDQFRVEFEGTSWNATGSSAGWVPTIGEIVTVEAVEGITLRVKGSDNRPL